MAGGINIPLNIPGLRQAKEDLKELNKQFEDAKKRGDDQATKKLAKEFNDLSKAIDNTTEELLAMNKAGQLVGTKFDDLNEVLFDTQQEVLPLTSQIGEMEDRLYQLVKAGETSGEEFKALTAEIVKNRQIIRETDKQIDLLAENQGLAVFAEGWSQVGASMLSLNFEQASKDASALQGAVGNLGQIGASSLKSLGSTVKTLGSTFLQFGKALLLNPIFLMSAAIAAIVFGVYKLLDALGFIQPVLDAIGATIGWVVDGFKSLTDWLGITSHEEQKTAEETRKKKVEESQKYIEQKEHEKRVVEAAINAEIAAIDRTIKLYQAQGKSVAELTKAKINSQIDLIKLQDEEASKGLDLIASAKDLLFKTNKFTDERVAKRQEAADKIADLETDIEVVEIEAAKEAADAWKQYAENRLNALRLIEDLEVEMMKKGIDRELKENELKYQRLIEDTKKDENLTREEKEKIAKYYDDIRIQQEGKIRKDYLDKEKEKLKKLEVLQKKTEEDALATIEQFQEEAYQLNLTDRAREEQALEYKYEERLRLAREYGQDETEILKAQKKEQDAINKKYADVELARQKAVQDAKFQMAQDSLSLISSATELFGKKNEKNAKKAFEVNKAAQIAQAIISTYQGANAIFASAAANPSSVLFPAQPFLTAGIAVANGLVNVAKIAQTKFESKSVTGGGGASAPSVGSSASVSSSTPSFNLFGQSNSLDEAKSAQSQELTQQIQVKAVVSETEVTNTQKKVNNIKESAEL